MGLVSRLFSRKIEELKPDSPAFSDRPTETIGLLDVTQEIKECLEAAIRDQERVARNRMDDPYYTDSMGHNVGEDQLSAICYARSIDFQPSPAEQADAALYYRRLLRDLEDKKATFRILEADEDGYGIASLHSITDAFVERFGGDFHTDETIAGKTDPSDEYFENESQLADLRYFTTAYLQIGNYLLALDAGQLYLFALALKLYRSSGKLEDAEILAYTKRLLDARSQLFDAIVSFDAPAWVLTSFYRYIAGVSNLLAFVQYQTSTRHPQQHRGKTLPFTNFCLDVERALEALRNQDQAKRGGIVVREYSDNDQHLNLLNHYSQLKDGASLEERGFLEKMFADPFALLTDSDYNTSLLHLVAMESYQQRMIPSGSVDLWCLTVSQQSETGPRVHASRIGDAHDIHEQIQALGRGAAQACSLGPQASLHQCDAALYALSQALWPPINGDEIAGVPLVILAEGCTSLIPFGALITPSGNTWCSGHAITVVNRLPESLTSQQAISNETSGTVIANPSFVAIDGDGTPASLPDSQREGEAIAGLWEWQMVCGRAATAEAAMSALRKFPVVHIASHGALREDVSDLTLFDLVDNPPRFVSAARRFMDAAAIVLSPAAPGSGESLLESSVLSRERWEHSQLVFLSLCEGSSGKPVGSEAPFGLARALRVAGTRIVVACLYPIEDETACDFAVLFHQKLHAGVTPAEALRQCQISFAERKYGWHAWGGYQLLQ